LNEIRYQNEELYKYLNSESNVSKLMNFVYNPKATTKYSVKKAGHLAFLAFKAISDCEEGMTEQIIKNK